MLFLLLALVPFAMAGELGNPQETAISSGQTAVRNTQNAGRTSIPLTQTAFKSTSGAIQAGVKLTATAIKFTSTALAADLRTTGTAVRENLSAGATEINATTVALRTAVKTQSAPLVGPQEAIEYYAANVLGIDPPVTMVTARKANIADAFKLAQTDVGLQIQRYGFGYAAVNDYAQLSTGYAVLSYGLGVVRVEDLPFSLVLASSGVFTMDATNTGVLNATSAFALAKTTYPKLADLTYIPWATSRGWAWMAKDAESLADTRTAKGDSGWVMLYVVPLSGGKAKVTAMVVLGQFTTLVPK
jgi:hypothetical protein